jgi:hypothetical protein
VPSSVAYIFAPQDILPLLPDFTEIDVFKDHICETLETCGHRIENLQHDMDELSASADEIQKVRNSAHAMLRASAFAYGECASNDMQ